MRPLVALLILMALAACQVTTSQSMGGVTFRQDAPLDEQPAADDPSVDDRDGDTAEERKPELTIGGGFSSGVSH